MTTKQKLVLCIIGNAITLIAVIITVTLYDDKSTYWSFGYSETLTVISVKINSLSKYLILLLFITAINTVQVASEEIGSPILGFSVYNPDKKHITEFTKMELQIYANLMFSISSIRNVFMMIVTITQIDIAIYSVIVKEIASIFTIRMLLNEKTFGEYNEVQLTEISIE